MTYVRARICEQNAATIIEFFSHSVFPRSSHTMSFFFAHTTLSVTGGSGVATAQSGPTPSQNRMGSDATARPLSTGFRDGAGGFLADPIPQTACSVIGTAPGVSMQTHPKLPSGPQANLVANPHARSALLALGLLLGHLPRPSSLSRAHAASNSGSPSPRPLASKSETS